MTPTLRFDYGPTGRERIGFECDHGSTTLGAAEIFFSPDGFAATIIRHRDRTHCSCEVGKLIRYWYDARIALRQYEAMALDIPPGVDELDVSVMLRDLVDLRGEATCLGCVPSWTATSEAGRLARQFHHDPGCPDLAARRKRGELRGMHSTIVRQGRPS